MPVFFVLQPGSWIEHETYLARPLLGTREGRPARMPWVALARGTREGIRGGEVVLLRIR